MAAAGVVEGSPASVAVVIQTNLETAARLRWTDSIDRLAQVGWEAVVVSDLRHLMVVSVFRESQDDSRSGRMLHDLGSRIGSCLDLELWQSKETVALRRQQQASVEDWVKQFVRLAGSDSSRQVLLVPAMQTPEFRGPVHGNR